MNWQWIRDRAVLSAKQLVYGRHGEPYKFAGQTLRFVPGTRPVRHKYLHSTNWVNRDDVLEILWLESHLEEGDVVIDVGAHYGIYSLLMAVRAAKVIAFEPDPYARAMLARNVKLNSKSGVISIEPFACSDREGEAVLFSRGGNANSSFARSAVEKQSLPLEKISVSTITLDRYLAEHSLSPRVVKIDAEGAEIRILNGASRLLATNAAILCELHPYAWAEFGNSLAELESLVAGAGRKMRYLDHRRKPNTYGMALLERSA
jgi:FkbM family methyltransferase